MGTSRRLLPLVLATVATIAAVALTATSAAALNGDTYNVIQNADRHQYCIDIDTTKPIGLAWCRAAAATSSTAGAAG